MSEANTEQEIVAELKKRLAWLESQLRERASYAHPSESHTLARFDGAITELKHVIEFIEKQSPLPSEPSGEDGDHFHVFDPQHPMPHLKQQGAEHWDTLRFVEAELSGASRHIYGHKLFAIGCKLDALRTALRELAEVAKRMVPMVETGMYHDNWMQVLDDFDQVITRHSRLLDGAPKKENKPMPDPMNVAVDSLEREIRYDRSEVELWEQECEKRADALERARRYHELANNKLVQHLNDLTRIKSQLLEEIERHA